MIVDIPETYGMWLSRDWSKKLKGYFATDWSHSWLPLNGQPNKLKVNREPFMKQTVTDLNNSNESVSYFSAQIEHFTFNTFFGDLSADISPVENVQKQSQITYLTFVPFSSTIVHNVYNVNTNFRINPFVWMLYFDGSRSKDGAGAECVLIDPNGTKSMIACRLDFECTNNVAEYEELVQGIRKAIDMGAKEIESVGYSNIIVKQVRNQIHCLYSLLNNYQRLIRDLNNSFVAFNIMFVPRS